MNMLMFEELSGNLIGAAMEVHRHLGPGFLEAVYEHALEYEFSLRRIPFERQVSLAVIYKETCVGDYKADFVIDGKIVLEIKAASNPATAHEAQTIHCLAATRLRVALLLNFGAKSLQFKRLIL
jgi:GxxExxY protein